MRLGDREAFGVLYGNYAPALMGNIIRIVGSNKMAEEVLQETFSEIWKHRADFNSGIESLYTRMVGVAKQLALAAVKAQCASATEIFNQLASAEEQVAEREKKVLDLFYFKGYTIAEVALAINLPEETVTSILTSATDQLNTQLPNE